MVLSSQTIQTLPNYHKISTYLYLIGKAIMQVLGFSEFRKNLASALDYVEDSHAPVIIKRGSASAIMLSLDDYNAHMETIYLLSNSANALHLLKGVGQVAAQGKTTQRAKNR